MKDIVARLKDSVPHHVSVIADHLNKKGHRTWVVGGCVRDTLRSLLCEESVQEAQDWDLCTDAVPDEVRSNFRRVIPTGIEHGTVTIVMGEQHFEITTLRGERGHSDGRHPDEVFFVRDLEEDLARRDFTVNAMAYDVLRETFHDPFDGLGDLKAGMLRAVGKPEQRFEEDGLRVLRCARFCATLGFSIEPHTRAAIRPSLRSFERVAQERVREEWFKALRSASPGRFLRVLSEEGILAITAPGLLSGRKDEAQASRSESAIERVAAALDAAPTDPVLRLALLCVLGAQDSANIQHQATFLAARLRLSKADSKRLVVLATHHRLPAAVLDSPSGPEGRRYLASIGKEEAGEVLLFQSLVPLSQTEKLAHEDARSALSEVLSSGCALTVKELCIGGSQLMAQAQVPKGPLLGEVLRHLFAAVLENPSLNEEQRLLDLARAYVAEHTD